MWKKLKGGRRQILQLEEKKPPKDSSKSKVKSLIHYSDSDDDSKKSNESESSSSSTAQTKNAAPLDSQIADFFKEIDALSVPEEILMDTDKTTSTFKTETVNEDTTKTCSSDVAVDLPASTNREDGHSDAPNTYCPWQEICDSSTGYNYYWNVQTNEVTWDCPPEYAAYIQSFNEGTENATHTAQDDRNANGKEKKNDVIVPEGAIIPISYFGDSSSSDNASDSESEVTNKNTKSEKLKETNKIVEKVDSRNKPNEEEISEITALSLPHCSQLSHTEAVAKETDPQMTISQNPVHEVVKTDSSLPLNNITEKLSQSALDELTAAPSTHEASWKNSLKDTGGKSIQLNEKTGDESPDSTVKKEENSLSHSAYQVINNAYGFRPVVDYDSFTDEEEEMSVVSISSSKPNEDKKDREIKSSSRQEQEGMAESSTKLLIGDQNKTSSFKRKDSEVLTESTKIEELIKKPKRTDVNIDSLFSSHSSYGKYGFGFGWRKPVDDQNNELPTTNTQSNKTRKHKSEFRKVSFIKSEDILDLKALNNEIPLNETSHTLVEKSVPTKAESDQSIVLKPNEKPLLNKEEVVQIVPAEENVKISNDCDIGSSSMISIKDKIDFSMLSKKRKISKSLFNTGTTSLKIDDDLDEIDKALCEALDAKKSAKTASVKSVSPVSDISNTSKCMAESSTPVRKLQETEPGGKDAVDTDALTEDILEMSSVILDKVTFLLTAPSTHGVFNGVFYQLQTRFVDWQAGALNSTYFMARLKELEKYIQTYEMSVVSGDWIYKWDRQNRRYFFTKIQNSQRTCPGEIYNQGKSSSVPRIAESDPPPASSFVSERDDLQTVSSSSTAHENATSKRFASESKDNSSGSRGILQCSPPPLPPDNDTPPPLPHTPPPESPPPPPKSPPMPPPESTETLREPEDMDIENSNDSSSFLFVTNRRIIDDKEKGVDDKERSTYYVNLPDEELKRTPTSYASYFRLIEDLSNTKGGREYLHNLSKSPRSRPNPLGNFGLGSVQWSRPSCSSQEKGVLNSAGSTSAITEIAANLTSTITEIPANLTSTIAEVPANLASAITAVPASLTSAITAVPASLTSAITAVPASSTSAITAVPASLTSAITAVPASLTSAITAVPASSTSAITEVPANLTSELTEAAAHLTSAVTESPAHLTSAVTEVSANLASVIAEVPTNLTSEVPSNRTSPITEVPANITSAITEVPANITSAITEVPANLTSAITEVPANLTSAITEVPANVTSAITEVPAILIEEKKSDIRAGSSNRNYSSQSDALHLKLTKPGSAVSKKEKKKAKIQLGLGLKKKNIPSLVEKWQKIKEEQNRENNIND